MSRGLKLIDLEAERRRWLRSFPPMANRDLARWESDWEVGISELPYVLTHRHNRGPLDDLVQHRVVVGSAFSSFDLIKVDFEVIWSKSVAKGKRACHAIVDRDGGFDFIFCDRDEDDHYVTGSVHVRKEQK